MMTRDPNQTEPSDQYSFINPDTAPSGKPRACFEDDRTAKKTISFKFGVPALAALWTAAIFGLSVFNFNNLTFGLSAWLAGLLVMTTGIGALKINDDRHARAAAAGLKRSHRQLRALLANLKSGVYIRNTRQQIVLANPRLCSLINIPMEQLLGSTGYPFLKPATAGKMMELERQVHREKQAMELYDLFDQADLPNGRVVTLYIFPLIGPDGDLEGSGGLMLDLTDLHRREQELVKARKAAQKASLAKNTFLSNISHELRSPLNGIIGMANLLERSKLTGEQASMAAVIKNAGDTLLAALDDVLDLSKIEAGNLRLNSRPFDLREMLFDLVKGLAPIAHNKGLDLIVNIAPQTPNDFYGDDTRFRQIILNLAANALKFTNTGGVKIIINPLEPSKFDLSSIKGKFDQENDHLNRNRHRKRTITSPGVAKIDSEPCILGACHFRLSVSDSGIGIARDKQEIIFEAFEQADTSTTRNYSGAGLGLTICYRLAAMMNSKLNLVSEEGKGSTFWLDLKLPIISRDTQREQGWLAATAYESFEGYCVLCVESDAPEGPGCADGFHDSSLWTGLGRLRDLGFTGREAHGADEALKMLKDSAVEGRPFSLLLADPQLRLQDGRDLLAAVRSEPALAGIPVVALSSTNRQPRNDRSDRTRSFGTVEPAATPELIRDIAIALGVWERYDAVSLSSGLTTEDALRSSRRLNILLSEDMEVNQTVARRMLEELGHQVTVASNGAETVELFKENQFDLVFMDIQMPVMDGLVATDQIRALESQQGGPHTPIVALTAHTMKNDRKRFLARGMDDWLSKPLLIADLAKLIENIIERRRLKDASDSTLLEIGHPIQGGTAKTPAGEQTMSPWSEKTTEPEEGKSGFSEAAEARMLDSRTMELSFGGNKELIRKSMELYLRDAPMLIDNISAALDNGNPAEAASQAHALKGISGYYTKNGPYRLAMDLDKLFRQGARPEKRSQLRRLAAELQSSVDALMAEMRDYLAKD